MLDLYMKIGNAAIQITSLYSIRFKQYYFIKQMTIRSKHFQLLVGSHLHIQIELNSF